jgi:hypothetical protein
LNSPSFIENINGYSYIVYDKNRKICEILVIKGNMLELTLEKALQNLPNDIIIMIFISIEQAQNEELIDYLANLGFGEPFICNTDDLDLTQSNKVGLYLLKVNFIVEPRELRGDISYLLQSISASFCVTNYKFSPKTIKTIEHLAKIGSSWNKDGNISQKELGGRFLAKINDKQEVVLEIEETSIISGKEEGVNVVAGLYNFHSHPLEAYERNGVSLGWPSGQDYLAFLNSFFNFNTILHVVISLEGVYILSLGDFWFDNYEITDIDEIGEFILEKYKLDCKDKLNPSQYEHLINKIRYQHRKLFNVKFLNWENISNTFSIDYSKYQGNCIYNQNLFNFILSL